MTKIDKPAAFSRRSVLKAGGAIVVSVGAGLGLEALLDHQAALAQGIKPPLMPDQLSSFIAVQADGHVMAYFGKMDVPFHTVKVDLADTATSVNQGGASGSTGIQEGGKQMRVAAAEARRVLVEMAATKLDLPADQLIVTDGVVHARDDAAKKASYAELIGGRYFNVQ